MGLQKRINKWLIKRAIGSKYIYQIEAEEESKLVNNDYDDGEVSSKLKSFFQEGLNEMKKEIIKKSE